MPPIHDEVGALTEAEHALHQIPKDLRCRLVGRIRPERFEIAVNLGDQRQNLDVALRLRARVLGQETQIRQQTHGRAGGDRPEVYASTAEQTRCKTLVQSEECLQRTRQGTTSYIDVTA